MTTAKYKVWMPLGKRVYNADMPLGKRVYNVWVDQDEYIRSSCQFIPNFTVADDPINVWYISAGLTVAENGSQWDITDTSSVNYETIDQMSTVSPIVSTTEKHHVDTTVNKETVDDHFLMIQINQYENFDWQGSNTPISEYRSAFNLVTGATAELLNPGGITNYAVDLTTKWRFIMEFDRLAQSTHILTQVYPAGGSSFSTQDPTATGSITVDCIQGFLYAYTP